jgi:hypothetical protein
LSAGNPETLGAPINLVVTIQDRTSDPAILRGNATIVEGDTGTTTEALFTFSLSAATGRTVTANYVTENLLALSSASCSNQGTRLTRSNSQFFDVRADDMRAVPNVDFAQVVIRLPDNLRADTYAVTIRTHGRMSTVGSIQIAP